MRILFVVLSLMLAAPLASCASGKGPMSSANLDERVAEIVARAKNICGFVPAASSVLAILSAGNPAVVGGVAVANAICSAVTAKSVRPGGCPKVNGVCVKGHFVS